MHLTSVTTHSATGHATHANTTGQGTTDERRDTRADVRSARDSTRRASARAQDSPNNEGISHTHCDLAPLDVATGMNRAHRQDRDRT